MNKLILGIETSCDETAASIVKDGREILSSVVASQIDTHRLYGGVVPEIASRQHLRAIIPVVDEALIKAGVTLEDLSAIGVASGPGLVGALLVGVSTAKALSWAHKIPIVSVNHLEGHIYANALSSEEFKFPLIALIASGGHSDIVLMRGHGDYVLLGQTRDDAAGEAFDKVARRMGLSYPGGPEIDRLAQMGDEKAIHFPRAYLEKGSLDFSFSGLKTSVVTLWERNNNSNYSLEDVSASFQAAVVEVLVEKTILAANTYNAQLVLACGGVAANSCLRRKLADRLAQEKISFALPSKVLCTDNAAMIASAAYYGLHRAKANNFTLNADPSMELSTKYEN